MSIASYNALMEPYKLPTLLGKYENIMQEHGSRLNEIEADWGPSSPLLIHEKNRVDESLAALAHDLVATLALVI